MNGKGAKEKVLRKWLRSIRYKKAIDVSQGRREKEGE
jgi:hypothetical protein